MNQYDQVSLVVGVVEKGSSKDGRKDSKDEVGRAAEKRLKGKRFDFS